MTKNFSVYQISDTLLREIKGAIKSVTYSGNIDASIQKGTVRKITTRKPRRRKSS